MRHLLAIALDWARRCFGEAQMKNPATRSLRVLEEAAELAQSCGVPSRKPPSFVCVKSTHGRRAIHHRKSAACS